MNNYTDAQLLQELLRRNKPGTAPKKVTYQGGWFESMIAVGKDHCATIYISDDSFSTLPDVALGSIGDALTASEAVYGFAAWLTCREKPMTLSSANDASEICNLVGEFIKTNSLGDPRSNYSDYLTHPEG